jgi:ABC-type branched-subunit amino acid transport system ATPase component
VATLAFATGPAEVDRWRQDNGRYLERIRARYPRLHDLIEEAAETMAGRRRHPDLEEIRARYPHLYALIEEAAGTTSGGAP